MGASDFDRRRASAVTDGFGMSVCGAARDEGVDAMDDRNRMIELFVHHEGSAAKPIRILATATVAQLLQTADVPEDCRVNVFVGECEHAAKDDSEQDDREDAHSAVETHLPLERAGVHDKAHVHCHRCHRVAVEVNYQSKSRRRRFSPATRISTVTEWARRAFKLTDIDASKLLLQISGTTKRPRGSEHVGELVSAPACSICFDLVHEHKVEG